MGILLSLLVLLIVFAIILAILYFAASFREFRMQLHYGWFFDAPTEVKS